MIEKEWLESQGQLIVEFYDDSFLHCRLDKREIHLSISHFLDSTYAISIHFLENGIILFRAEMYGLQIDTSKESISAWLVNKIPHDRLAELNESIVQDDIYDAYTKGEDAMLEYHWHDVKGRLQEMVTNISKEKSNLIEALELCQKSYMLKRFIPYISVGRLCLSKTTVFDPYSTDCFCLNYTRNKFEVADYVHQGVQLFDNAFDAVKFIEGFYKTSKENRHS